MIDPGIIHSVKIKHGKVLHDGKLLETFDPSFKLFSKELHNRYSKGYSKFFKMDTLSKLGFLSAEILLHSFEKDQMKDNEVAIVLGNSEATTPTDKKYFESVAGIPSPALFVYTLPNIMIGEICIRQGFKGENLFFVAEKFDVEDLFQHVQTVLTNREINWIIAGWVNYTDDKAYESMVYLVAQNRNNCKFTSRNMMELNNYNFK